VAQVRQGLPRASAERLPALRRVDIEQPDLDLLARYQKGQRVAVSYAYDAADKFIRSGVAGARFARRKDVQHFRLGREVLPC
jgi:hypothetical protein